MRNAIVAVAAAGWLVKALGLVAAIVACCNICGCSAPARSSTLTCWMGDATVTWTGADVRFFSRPGTWVVDGSHVTAPTSVCTSAPMSSVHVSRGGGAQR